jgi:alkylation response protein AidB-like acyl-CoA dehydrogenase
VDLAFSKADNEFRDQARTWLAENAPTGRPHHLCPETRTFDTTWQRRQFDGGWAGISWPKEYGGLDLPILQQLIWYEEYGRTGLPAMDTRFVGLSHAGPTLIARATDEQKTYHLPKILSGETLWCQGFSEPGAGSDLASLRTKAVIDGDQLVVTGQKIWTSYAGVCDWQELLVRTNPDVPKHKGISWVICDMHAPGVEVRPIKTIDGDYELNEVFYDEVRIPLTNVVGEIDQGWSVTMSTLSFERGTAFTLNQVTMAATVEALIELAGSRRSINGRPVIEDDVLAMRLAKARADAAGLRALTYMAISRNARSSEPGPEGSMLKLQYSDLAKRVQTLGLDIIGPRSLALVPGEADGDIVSHYLTSFSYGIGGGTSEVQRNIIAERVLGLPR